MGRLSRCASTAALVVASVLMVLTTPAFAQTSGTEKFNGLIVASGASGERELVSSPVVAKGVFDGVGRVVEIPNLPTDPDDVSRDDFMFRAGTLHIVTTTQDFQISLNPSTCVATFAAMQTSEVEGGTGRFADATGSFDASVHGRALAQRAEDGSCSQEQAPLVELDVLALSGHLSF
jgi:hypothetical protein